MHHILHGIWPQWSPQVHMFEGFKDGMRLRKAVPYNTFAENPKKELCFPFTDDKCEENTSL